MLTDQELEALLAAGECDRVQFKFKASGSVKTKIRQTICGFANDMPGHGKPGVLFVGVNNDGSCANTPVDEHLLATLAGFGRDGSILPQPDMIVQKRVLRGCEVAVAQVLPASAPPVRLNGTAWVWSGTRVDPATPQQEQVLGERRRAGDLPYDHRAFEGTTTADLNLEFFETAYLPHAISPDVLERNARSREQQLRSLRFLTPTGVPTVGALLVLGRDPTDWVPGAYIQFVRFDGTALTDPIKDEKRLDGPLHQVLARLDEVLEINISTAVDVRTSPETRKPDYPLVALQQLARNAVMHRTYENTNAPVRFHWFSDRVEILSPGGLYGQVNPVNFGRDATDYRNPLVAEAMKVLGYVQRFGLGIPLARKELQVNGNPEPDFRFGAGTVLAIVRAAP